MSARWIVPAALLAAGCELSPGDIGPTTLPEAESERSGTLDGSSQVRSPSRDDGKAARSIPPFSGGALWAEEDMAFVGDPEVDRLYRVDLVNWTHVSLQLEEGDEPGRMTRGPNGLLYVVLRGAGDLLALEPLGMDVVARSFVCGEPRGVDASQDHVYVACAGGMVHRLDPSTLESVDHRFVAADLRDVLVRSDGKLWVTTFRTAQVFLMQANLLLDRKILLQVDRSGFTSGRHFEPRVAWRSRIDASDRLYVLHQLHDTTPIRLSAIAPEDEPVGQPGPRGGLVTGYGGGAGVPRRPEEEFEPPPPVVLPTVTTVAADGTPECGIGLRPTALPLDMDVTEDLLLVGFAGAMPRSPGLIQAVRDLTPKCEHQEVRVSDNSIQAPVQGLTHTGREWVWVTREADGLEIHGRRTVRLRASGPLPSGHVLFHRDTDSHLACASCHPEGQDDAHTWNFVEVGRRRTQYLRGGLDRSAPLHWDGEFDTMQALLDDVFSRRMGGGGFVEGSQEDLVSWVEGLSELELTPNADAAQIRRGRKIFESATAACSGCHADQRAGGSLLFDVGTGAPFKVPPLIDLVVRAPYMHDGCAEGLRQRFVSDTCGGQAHGEVGHLTDSQLDDLEAFLLSL